MIGRYRMYFTTHTRTHTHTHIHTKQKKTKTSLVCSLVYIYMCIRAKDSAVKSSFLKKSLNKQPLILIFNAACLKENLQPKSIYIYIYIYIYSQMAFLYHKYNLCLCKPSLIIRSKLITSLLISGFRVYPLNYLLF